MKYLSLFSGIGGFELGIQQAYEDISAQKKKERTGEENEEGIRSTPDQPDNETNERLGSSGAELQQHSLDGSTGQPTCIGYSEIDKYATKIYQSHFPEHKNYGDITQIKTEDLPEFDLLVGGFPCQSFSIAGKRGGFSDTRGTLFFEIARILKAKQPRLFLLENVKGLLSHDEGRTFRTIISTLDELGYDLQWQVLNSKNFGVPQNRERVFIIGHLRGTSRPEVFPIGEVGDGISKEDDPPEVLPAKKTGRITYADKPLLQTISERPIHIRRLTPTECARLQGFPDDWHKIEGISDTQAYKVFGNAVTVNVIREVAKRLIHS